MLPQQEWHPGWHDLAARIAPYRPSRRRVLRGAALGAAGLAALPIARALGATNPIGPFTPALGLPDRAGWNPGKPIKHVVVLCQENRSFDHYFGSFASQLGATGFDRLKPALRYPTADGKRHAEPFHLTYFCDDDPDHTWAGSHAKFANGRMNGFLSEEGDVPRALGYYTESDHLFHVQLAKAFTLADHYFCSQIGPTLPNRLHLWTGTSGFSTAGRPNGKPGDGLPYDNPPYDLFPPTLEYFTLADVVDAKGLPWRSYSVADGSVPNPVGAFNPLIFFESIRAEARKMANALADFSRFIVDLALGQLPAVSWIVTEAVVSEHPPAPPDFGQLLVARVVEALMGSTAWDSTVLFVTYDEGGGYFDHVAPPAHALEIDHATGEPVGPGFRVPMTIVSPFSRPGYVFKEPLEHTSIIQFIERTFDLEKVLPIAPVRRNPGNYARIEDALDMVNRYPQPALATVAELAPYANETILSVDVERGALECGSTLPRWLPSVLGLPAIVPYPYPKPS